MTLYLIRHGQTAWNAEGRAQGHTNIPLDEVGLFQAQALGEAFFGRKLAKVLTSDMDRSIQTAKPIVKATGAELIELPVLRERSLGDWEGYRFADLKAALHQAMAQNASLFEATAPNGESMADVWQRLLPFSAQMKSEVDNVAIVTHGGTAALLLAQLVNATIETSRAFRFSNTGVCEMCRLELDRLILTRYNDTSHLNQIALQGDVEGSIRA